MQRAAERSAEYVRLCAALDETIDAMGAAMDAGNLAELRRLRQRLATLRAELAVWLRDRGEH